MDSMIKKGPVNRKWNAAGTKVLSYYQEIWHTGLKDHKVITAPDMEVLNSKVEAQIYKWNKQWADYTEKIRLAEEKKANIEKAEQLTLEAQNALSELENLLTSALDINHEIDWDSLKRNEPFSEPMPVKPKPPVIIEFPEKPSKSSPKYTPRLSLITKIFKSIANKRIEQCEKKYAEDIAIWESNKRQIEDLNEMNRKKHEEDTKKWEADVREWEKRKAEFIENQRIYNENIDNLKLQYNEGKPQAVVEYCKLVLNNSVLPEFIKKEFDIDYIPDTRILIVDYMLPVPEDLPRLKEVKYVQSENRLKEVYYTSSFLDKLYDTTIYRLLLRIIHELFDADTANNIDAISLNGWVNFISKATGKRENACIASIQVRKETFSDIDLKNVDPKICFKNLKGVGSSKLSGITPIQPILQINKNDHRFIQSREVVSELDSSTNLATMDWEEFEHLIRELFEKEFSSYGGEVKVTRASRDGGVDAVVFDPDPIRGGKIVIQAKRYTNTVGVAAVRDLYGTVVNEGATKGILVTTADYGPDAYEFAKNKSLTLLNGSNLLHLLEKHGHKARIDLQEAKMLNKD